MTKKDKLTPLQAARQYAEAHPDFEGEVNVISLRSKSRRRGQTRQINRVWVTGGRAALIKILGGKNGPCRACGRIVLDPVLINAYRRDERAGQPLGETDLARWKQFSSDTTQYVYDHVCCVHDVCPACVESLGLGPYLKQPLPDWRQGSGFKCVCEPTGFVAYDRRPPMVEIDLSRTNE